MAMMPFQPDQTRRAGKARLRRAHALMAKHEPECKAICAIAAVARTNIGDMKMSEIIRAGQAHGVFFLASVGGP